MARTEKTHAKLAELNDPAPETPAGPTDTAPAPIDRRTTSPTPEAEKSKEAKTPADADDRSTIDAAREEAEKVVDETASHVKRHAQDLAERLPTTEGSRIVRTASDRMARASRRNPALFFGGAALLGFSAALLLSARHTRTTN